MSTPQSDQHDPATVPLRERVFPDGVRERGRARVIVAGRSASA